MDFPQFLQSGATTVLQTESLVSFTFYPIARSVIALTFNTSISQISWYI